METLASRTLMAVDLEVPPAIVSQFPAQFNVVDSPADGATIGVVLNTVSQTSLTGVFQSESYGGNLYTVGNDNSKPGYVMTDLSTGVSTKTMLPSLNTTLSEGSVLDINDVGSQRWLVGAASSSSGATRSPTMWNSSGVPVLVSPPSGATPFGQANSITHNGLIGGQSGRDAFIKTNQGSFFLPTNGTTGLSSVRSVSESGRYLVGGLDGTNALWTSVGNTEDGNYRLESFAFELPPGSQGLDPLRFALDNTIYGGIGLGEYVNENGDNVAGIWSLTDGLLIKDFGAGSAIADATVVNGETFVAFNDGNDGHILTLESGKAYDLKNLLGSNGTTYFTPGGIFTSTFNGKPIIGFSYYENNALKASVFELRVTTAELAWDFEKDGTVDVDKTAVSLPDSTAHVYTKLGQTTVQVVVTINGVPTTLEKMVDVVNVSVVDRKLYLGGDSGNDVVVLEKFPNGGLKVTVNGTETSFAAGAVDQVFANLGGGNNSLEVSGLDLNSANLWHVGKLKLTNGSTLTDFTSSAASQLSAESQGGGGSGAPLLLLDVPPTDIGKLSPLRFSGADWKYVSQTTVDGLPAHIFNAVSISVVVKNGVYQNPLNYLDPDGDGNVSPLDVLVLNQAKLV